MNSSVAIRWANIANYSSDSICVGPLKPNASCKEQPPRLVSPIPCGGAQVRSLISGGLSSNRIKLIKFKNLRHRLKFRFINFDQPVDWHDVALILLTFSFYPTLCFMPLLLSLRFLAGRSLPIWVALGITAPVLLLAPSQAATAPATAGAATEIYSGYLLGPGDQVDISVFGYTEFTGNKVVLPDGTINLPVIGAVVAADRTPEDLRRDILARLNQILVEPVVTVNLTTLRPIAVNVTGEVQRPGPIQLRSLTNSTFQANNNGFTSGLQGVPTVSSALMAAGGVTRNADIQKVILRRTLPGGKSALVTVNLWNAIWSEQQPDDVVLRAGDSVYIPPLPAGSTVDRRLIARSSLAPGIVKVRVVGEVNRPGEIQISPDSSISSAIANAGGPTKNARLKSVQLIRLDDKGQIATQELDLQKLNDGFQVQEGDVVIVPEKGGSKFLRGLGQVLSPFNNLLGIFNRF
jgi:polysaccharide biosynthesis/export protein